MVHVELTNYRMSIIYSNAKGTFKTHTIFRVQGQAIIFHSIIENNELLNLIVGLVYDGTQDFFNYMNFCTSLYIKEGIYLE